jgi:hypothetical protein
MRFHDMYALSSYQLFNRTGLYAESHGIVANVSHKRAVLDDRLTRCAEFLGCRYRLTVSFRQRLVLLATSLVARRTGAAVGIRSVILHLLMPVVDVGNGWESRTHYCQPYVVSVIPFLFLRCPMIIVRPGPPQTLSEASPTYFVPFAVCTLISASGSFQ